MYGDVQISRLRANTLITVLSLKIEQREKSHPQYKQNAYRDQANGRAATRILFDFWKFDRWQRFLKKLGFINLRKDVESLPELLRNVLSLNNHLCGGFTS